MLQIKKNKKKNKVWKALVFIGLLFLEFFELIAYIVVIIIAGV
jgi:hypothetical protein